MMKRAVTNSRSKRKRKGGAKTQVEHRGLAMFSTSLFHCRIYISCDTRHTSAPTTPSHLSSHTSSPFKIFDGERRHSSGLHLEERAYIGMHDAMIKCTSRWTEIASSLPQSSSRYAYTNPPIIAI
jgi:hypothetical protein